ncbi:response regulator, partial [Bacteroides sp. OttesenSCG-928-E20]|nr:response regulator [Bacteroides sp. OttesenSCG-928-E20]
SMTQLLQGQIEVTSKVNEYARFVVTLPLLQTDEKTPTRDIAEASPAKETDDGTEKEKELILIIDDNEEVLWMLKDILAADYKIAMAKDGQTGLEILKKETPHLIITDIMMPQMDGITLTRLIKENKHTMHIPLIILSAKHSNEEKIEGINSGADIYISKPFNTDYLKSIIRQQLRKRRNMEQYYTSSASAFEFANGQLLKKEDKEFLQTIIDVIDRNIDNSDFAPEELANSMQISIRKLYRKLKELEQLPPNDFIKEQRIRYAARLIVTTTLTIQEIMYKSGFTNHSHFYKAFAKRFNQTPKEYRETNKA